MAGRVQARDVDEEEGRRLLRTVRRGTGSVVTWRRAQMVPVSAQKMSPAKIAEVTFTSEDRVRDVIRNFNADGFDSLYPKYAGGRQRVFNLPERREIKKNAKSKPVEHGLPFSTWSLSKLADFLVAEGGGRRHLPRGTAYSRNDGVRHLLAAYNLIDDKLFGHVKPRKKRVQFLEFARY